MTRTMGRRLHDLPWQGIVVLVTAVALVTMHGCGDGPFGLVAGPPSRFLVVSGDSQQGAVGLELPLPLVLRVTDSAGVPVRGHTVEFRVVAGDGTLSGSSATTDAQGIARNRWTLGTTVTSVVDSQRVEVRAATATSVQPVAVATFVALAVAGPATTLLKYQGDREITTPTGTLSPSVRVVDRFGNPVTETLVTWDVAPGNGTVSPAESRSAQFGVARTTWTSPSLVGTYVVVASAQGLAGNPQTFTLAVTPDSAVRLGFCNGNGQTAIAGTTLPRNPAAWAFDRYGNTTEADVTFHVVSGGGSITGALAHSFPDRAAQVGSWTLGPQAGRNELAATIDGVAGKADTLLFVATATAPPPPRDRKEVYDLVATFTRVYAGSHVSDANATITGELALVDTVSYVDGDITYEFPITLIGKFCYNGTSECEAPKTWPGRYSLGADGYIVISLYRETLFTAPVLQLRAWLVGGTMNGAIEYNYSNYWADWYFGTFVATRK